MHISGNQIELLALLVLLVLLALRASRVLRIFLVSLISLVFDLLNIWKMESYPLSNTDNLKSRDVSASKNTFGGFCEILKVRCFEERSDR